MPSSTLVGGRSRAAVPEGTFVVDVDVHVQDTPAELAPYCDLPWRRSLEALARIPLRYIPIPGLHIWTPLPTGEDGGRRMFVESPRQAREDLDDLGVDVGVLFPDNLLLHAALAEADFAVAVARAYNRWLVERWLGAELGLAGAVIAPHHDPTAAAAEIRRYADNANVVAVFLPTAGVDPLWGDRRYDPVFDAAQETGLPVFLHSVLLVHPAFPFNLNGFETGFAAHFFSHVVALAANLVKLLETGVPVRFPELKVAFTEGGIAWVPWIMLRLDEEFTRGRRREVPLLTERPSAYVRRMFFATQPLEDAARLAEVAALISLGGGEDSVIYASDWPHSDFDAPSRIGQLPVSDEVKRKILGLNAAALLGLEVPAR